MRPAPTIDETLEIGDTTEVTAPCVDLAGFDIDDENAFFHAVLVMESRMGAKLTRAEIMQRFGVVDHDHWHTVKESMYAELIRKYGSMDEVGDREIAWRLRQIR